MRVDAPVLTWLQQFRSPQVDAAARVTSLFGLEAVWGLLALWLVRLGRTERWESAVDLVVAWGGAEALNSILKHLVRRTRPQPVESIMPGQTFSFPSGHAMVAAAFYFFLAYRSWRTLCGWQRVVCSAGSILLIVGVGLSRLYLRMHYLSDVLGGYLAGGLWTGGVILARQLVARKRRGWARRRVRRWGRIARRNGLIV